LEVQNGASITLDHSTVSDNLGAGIYLKGTNLSLIVSNSTISNNYYSGITSEECVDCSYDINITYSLFANNGFNSYGLYLSQVKSGVVVDHNVFANNRYTALVIYGLVGQFASPIITNNTFTNNGGVASVRNISSGVPDFSGNSNTSSTPQCLAFSGALTLPFTFLNLPGIVYCLDGLSFAAPVTIQPGVIFKFPKSGSYPNLVFNGGVNAQGTAANPIYFTSLSDGSVGGSGTGTPMAGDWVSIQINGGTANFSYTTIRYGGNCFPACATLEVQNGASITLDHSTVSDNLGAGIYLKGTNLSLIVSNSTISNNRYSGITSDGCIDCSYDINITYSVISNNNDAGLSVGQVMSGVVQHNKIFGNRYSGLYNYPATSIINAKNNWWGSDSGPNPFGSGNGINYNTYWCGTPLVICHDYNAYVDAVPWIGQASSYGQNNPTQALVGEPVNTANGNYTYARSDLSISTRSLPLVFSRSYNSSYPTDGPLGFGWTFSYNVSIAESGMDNSATVTYGDGRTVRFEWNGATYSPPAGTFSTLIKLNGLFTLSEKEQTLYSFNSAGKLATIRDHNGNLTTLNYSGTRLDSVTSPDGRMLGFTYDATNHLIQIQDPLNRTLGFGFDANGDLVSTTDLRGKTTHYTYNASHRLLTITDANTHTFVTNTYNSDGRVSEQLDADGNLTNFVYDIVNHKTTVTDALNHSTIYEYDADLRLVKETNALNKSETYTWDAVNNRRSITDRRGNTTLFTYDDHGNLKTVTDPEGGITTDNYDSYNNLVDHTDANGNKTIYTYDLSNNLINKQDALLGNTSYAYYFGDFRNGLLHTITDPNIHTTTFDYDSYGYVNSVTDARGYTSHMTNDAGGRRLTSTTPLGFTTLYTYDEADHVLTITDARLAVTTNTYDDVGNLRTVEDPLHNITTNTYTTKDQLKTVTNAEGYVTTYEYDKIGNRTAIMDGNNHTTQFAYDEANRLTSTTNALLKTTYFTYDENGSLLTVTDPLTHTTTYTYDKLNRRKEVKDALTHTTTTIYDYVGNIKQVIDANNKSTYYFYDELNHLRSVKDAMNGVVEYTYDGVGNRKSMKDANNHITYYTYDEVNHLKTEKDPLDHLWTYTFDEDGRRHTKLDPEGITTNYTYDETANLKGISNISGTISYEYYLTGTRKSMQDGTGLTSYTYDKIYRPLAITQPGGTINYGYDANNRISVTLPGNLTTTLGYDAANRLTSVTDWNTNKTTYAYDDADRLTITTFPNEVVTTNAYDIADRLTGINTMKGLDTLLSITYALDNVGNRTSMSEPDGVTNYTYDDLYRLTGVTYPSGLPLAVTYTYDPMGNRKTMTQDGILTTSDYDIADRLLSTTTGAVTTDYTWDNNGNMLSKGSQTFSWDAFGHLTGLTNGSTTASYTYNGDGVRVGRIVNGTGTAYLQDLAAGLPIVMAETTNANTARYVYGVDLISQVDGINFGYYHADGLGSTRVMTDIAGVQSAAYTYDAFGSVRSQSGGAGNSFTYTGEQVDPEAGLVFLRARYYDPNTGRFISRDKISGTPLLSSTLNRYPYANNNPVTLIDPSGTDWRTALGVGTLALGTAALFVASPIIAGTLATGAALGGLILLQDQFIQYDKDIKDFERKNPSGPTPEQRENQKRKDNQIKVDLILKLIFMGVGKIVPEGYKKSVDSFKVGLGWSKELFQPKINTNNPVTKDILPTVPLEFQVALQDSTLPMPGPLSTSFNSAVLGNTKYSQSTTSTCTSR
jgi:RHS repeat-associated protein